MALWQNGGCNDKERDMNEKPDIPQFTSGPYRLRHFGRGLSTKRAATPSSAG
jgi:hypothetical protein